MFYGSTDSLNEPGITYVWIPPISDTKCGVNNKLSRDKLDCILKVNNTTVHQVDCIVNNVTNISLYDSCFALILHPIRERIIKKVQRESDKIFFVSIFLRYTVNALSLIMVNVQKMTIYFISNLM